ncbi:MAG: type II secretion system F family protein [Gammaproteobacteria bacterium]|nr:type II secretion system F family protein [Gammaproteobacteria bacterium]
MDRALVAKKPASNKKKAQIFIWTGVNRSGKKVKGEMEGLSPSYIGATLRRQGIKPGKIRKKPKSLFSHARRITTKDITVFTRQLATMLSAGIPIAQSIDIVANGHDNPSMKEQLTAIRLDVESGTSLATALGKYPRYYDALFTNLVDAGEQSGTLESLLDKIATYKEKTEAIKSKIKSAMFYPAAILVVSIVVTAILMIFVIPQFESLFQGFGADLPALTAAVVAVSYFFQDYWWIIFGALIGGIVLLVAAYKRSEKMQHTMDRVLLKLPVLGAILKKGTIARFSRTLATMFSAGVPLVDALASVAGASGNRVYYEAVMDVRAEVSTGTHLEPAMSETGVFTNLVLQMVAIGEESGELDTMLNKVADFYEQEVDDAVDAMTSLLEPFIMIFLGGLIGTMVVAMYLPIFKMAAVF